MDAIEKGLKIPGISKSSVAQLHFSKGKFFSYRKDYKGAIPFYKLAIESAPDEYLKDSIEDELMEARFRDADMLIPYKPPEKKEDGL